MNQDPSNSANIYLLKVVQQQSFTAVFAYLQSPQGKKESTRISKKLEFVHKSEGDDPN